MQWPAVHGAVRPQNASLRLYGGAAFERCLDEFQEAAHVVQFPTGTPTVRQRAFSADLTALMHSFELASVIHTLVLKRSVLEL